MDTLNLSAEQEEILLSAFADVAVLIGAADGNMDEEELAWSKKVTHIRTFSGHEQLFEFYKKLDEQIGQRIADGLQLNQDDPAARETELISRLERVDSVLSTLTPQFGSYIYHDLLSYAKHIARASGGFLRFFSISAGEKEFMSLPMITPVIWDEEEE